MKRKCKLFLASIPLFAALLAVLLGIGRLSRPDENQLALLLGYTAEETNDWHFETERGSAVPQLGFGGYFEGIADAESGPVAASRIMEDPGMRNLLEFSYYGAGIQVFLDDELLYTDFPSMDNRADAFLANVDTSAIERDALHVFLPYDCIGKTLRVVTYGPLWDGCRPVIFPSLVNRFSDAIIMTSDVAWDYAAIAALALLSLLLLLVFFLGEQTGQHQWRLLPLAAYFFFAAVPLIRQSFISTASGVNGAHPLLEWLSLVYVDFLIIFLAAMMKGWRKWTLLAVCGIHMALATARVLWNFPAFPDGISQDPAGLMLLVASTLLMLFSWKERIIFRWSAVCVLLSATAMFAFWAASHWIENILLYQLSNPVNALLTGDPRAFYRIICAIVSVLCAAGVTIEFVREFLQNQKREQMLLLRNQMAQESYARALDAVNRTSTLRHEWKNQIASLQLLHKQGNFDEVGLYLQALDTRLDQLVPQHYCDHFTINTILQNAAAHAADLGIHFAASAPVPVSLNLPDGDLCTLLLNMLDNALEAAAQVSAAGQRRVECSIRIKQEHLAIKCENGYSGTLKLTEQGRLQSTKGDQQAHGYGIAQMQAIAEKNGSVLDISYTREYFTVQTALKIH